MKRRHATLVAVLGALGLIGAAAPAAAGPARLLMDINRTPSRDMGSFPDAFHRLGNRTFFRATTRDTGIELWVTDGTEAGTRLVKDIWPGPKTGVYLSSGELGAVPFEPVDLGDSILFPATDGVHGWELWISDGTEAGTRMVREIRPGTAGPFDAKDRYSSLILTWTLVEAGGAIYFIADDGVHGFEMWRTDGTEAGTVMLKEIRPGPVGPFGSLYRFSFPAFTAAKVGNSLFFTGDDGVDGTELWTTDGTEYGTWRVKDIAPGPEGSYPRSLFDLDGLLLFWVGSTTGAIELWRSDGTWQGTSFVRNVGSAPIAAVKLNGAIVYPRSQLLCRTDGTFEGSTCFATFTSIGAFYGVSNGTLLFGASDAAHGLELWRSDGTAAGTSLVKDIKPGTGSSSPAGFLSDGGRFYCLADDGVHGRELWTSDGTEGGTHLVVDLTPGPTGTTTSLYGAGGLAYMSMRDASGTQLWRTDGTEAGTWPLRPLQLRSGVGAAHDGSVLIGADDGIHGVELWRSDGTVDGTLLLKDVNPLVRTDPSYAAVSRRLFVPGIGERVFFSADDDVHGRELWITDGTPQGTRLFMDIKPGPDDSSPGVLLEREGALFFLASDGVHGRSLWRTDGTEAGTAIVMESFPGLLSPPVEFHGSLWFVSADADHGWEIWQSDLTAAGTHLAVETIPGPDSSILDYPVRAGDKLFFSTWNQAANDSELWRTDGTQAGTGPVMEAGSAGAPFYAHDFHAFGAKLFFTAFDPQQGWEPWISDGTGAGTHMLRDIGPSDGWSIGSPSSATVMGGSIYFAANDGVHSEDLWKSDGTEAGTVLVKDLRPGSPISGINWLVEQGGTLYFTAGTSSFHTWELWKSDGTEQGTVQIHPDLGAFPYGLTTVPGGLVFAAWDPDHGYELWRSDGTTGGTALVQDIAPGWLDSRPRGYTVVGHRTFFLADDGFSGYEPWVARTAILLNQPGRAVLDLMDQVRGLGLEKGLETSLLAQLDAAARALSAGRSAEAGAALDAFGRHVAALTPRWIPEGAAADVVEFAAEIAGLPAGAR